MMPHSVSIIKKLLLVFVSLILLVSGFWAIKLHIAQRRAKDLTVQLGRLQVGKDSRESVEQSLRSFDAWRTPGEDCFGGPCLQGFVYRIRRGNIPFLFGWPTTVLDVGVFFNHGALVIKDMDFSQASGSDLRVTEFDYPFPDRKWDRDNASGIEQKRLGGRIIIASDLRASESLRQQSFGINADCFTTFRGCPSPEELQAKNRQ